MLCIHQLPSSKLSFARKDLKGNMDSARLQPWLGRVIVIILFLDCFSCDATRPDLPLKDLISISGNDFRGAHPRWFRREYIPVRNERSSRSRSALEVSSSQVFNATAEAEMLLEFHKGVTGDPLNVLASWNSNNVSSYCAWTGVNCSSPVGPVLALNLSGYRLEGTISPSLGGLQSLSSIDLSDNIFLGTIPTAIAHCSRMNFLNVSNNLLSGAIPSELSELSNLEQLDLSSNTLTGVLPPSISNVSGLRVFQVGRNQISGNIVSFVWGGLGQLERLDLSYNHISGAIPESLSSCTNLVDLELAKNNFTGIITDIFATLQKLEFIDLSSNDFTGSIPDSLGSLQALRVLYLSDNTLTGSTPPSLSNCSSLEYLILQDNQLTGGIPLEIGMLSELRYLDLAYNNLTGSIPLSLLNCSSLTALLLQDNQLTGGIPADIGVLSQLQYLSLWGNNLNGSIPLSLLNCASLSEITLGYNSFSGEIPQALGTLTQLESLDLRVNNFQGGIPASLGNNSSSLALLQLDSNFLVGEIPSQLGFLKNLSILSLSSNFLVGQIPASLGNSTFLTSLAMAKNRLSGQIPPSIGELTKLEQLDLSYNEFSGGIPATLANCTQLSVLDLSGNLLNETVPNELGTLGALRQLLLNNNNFTGSISFAFEILSPNLGEISLAYNSFNGTIAGYNFWALGSLQQSLDLSHNMFSGTLPSTIGALQFVKKINFSFNNFSGAITDAFSQCAQLQSLDLSSNDLDGAIPQSLTTLQHLTYFNVSFNQLTGSVPDSGEFANFGNGLFLGNPGLCGPMLAHKCGSSCSGLSCHIWIIIIPVVSAAIAGALALAGIWFLFIAKTSDSSGIAAPSLPNASHFTSEVEGLSVGDIVAAANGFSDRNIMGVGSKSTVFSGILPSGVMIAVKRLEMRNDDAATGRLYRELQRLAKLEHPNLLKFYGLFSSGDLKALVLEYMPNGSLRKQMHEGKTCHLTWAQRLNIAVGVAEAMVHLHHSGSKPIIHMDLKPSNILLDLDMEPKVADFGISRFLNHEDLSDTTMSSNLYGTIGYIPPEYGALTSVSTMGDVYNFGVVLMELFTRKQPTDDMFGQEVSLRSWVVDAFPGRISQILDSSLHQELAQNEQEVGIHLMVRLAVACTRNSPKDRPTMIEARDMLMEIKSIEQPYYKSGQLQAPVN